jgi:hypothetical protein
VDETRAFFDPFGLRFDPIGSDRALDARFDGEFLSGIYVAFVQFGTAAVVRAEWETAYSVKLPLQGGFEATSRHEVVSCATCQGVVLSPTSEIATRSRDRGHASGANPIDGHRRPRSTFPGFRAGVGDAAQSAFGGIVVER